MNEEENINPLNQRIFRQPPIIRFNQNTPATQETEEETIEPIHEPSLEIVGTAHISDKSIDKVRETIYEKNQKL